MRYQFQDIVVDTDRREVLANGAVVRLPARAFSALQLLLERAGAPVSHDELLREIWPDTHVVPNSVPQAIGALRRGLAGTRAARCIEAVPRVGYRVELADGTPKLAVHWRGRLVGALRLAAMVAALLLALDAGRRIERATRDIEVENAESVRLRTAATERIATRRGGDLLAAIDLLSRAVVADPGNAGAFAELAQARYLAGFYGVEDQPRAFGLARDAATRALTLDPGLARAYLIRASVSLDIDWNLPAAARDFRRAIEIDPSDPLAHHWSAWWCLAAGRMRDARAAIDRAVSLDPFSPAILTARATFAYLDGDYEAAAIDAQRALDTNPEFFRARLRLGLVKLALGHRADAIADLEAARQLAPDVPGTSAALAYAFAVSRRAAEAEAMMAEGAMPLYERAVILTGLGKLDAAAAALKDARQKGELVAGLFAVEPRLAPLRTLPLFQALQAALPAQDPSPTKGLFRAPGGPTS